MFTPDTPATDEGDAQHASTVWGVKPALVMAAGWLAATMALAMSAPAAAQTASRCLLEVDGHRYIDGRCRFTPQGEGSFQIRGLGRVGYFATVLVDGRQADGFWNGREQGNHAHARLGVLVRRGACWQNRRARVCAWQ
jgi:hypothetical protein